ncbi:MAG: monovalent cation:proton antiporter-2 (CPA2) family protein [Gammaproteobacteria bacterium]|jgi:monovalent cation:proton antiporter-2 (CPA2) family protein
MEILYEAVKFLLAAVIIVPIFKHLGFGTVLGYLTAGILIGPYGLNLVTDVQQILHFAELGVVLLLFIIGLELKPSRLWTLRNSIFVWGTIQMIASTTLFTVVGLVLNFSFTISFLVGFTLSLSSTAFALQMLAERRELAKRHGRAAFSILLFQDMAVVPLLAVLPLLAVHDAEVQSVHKWGPVIIGLVLMLILIFAGRILLRYFLRIIAGTDIKEILTASALLIVVGTAIIVEQIGLSMALGAFLAGVLLADSEYRHQLEADIEPFKGLLLGLFFIAVGMSVNISIIQSIPGTILGVTTLIILIKATVLFVLGRLQGMNYTSAKSLALSISQGGEFAFVVFAAAMAMGIIESGLIDILIVAVTLSMVMTPILLKIDDKFCSRKTTLEPEFDLPTNENNQIIIAGFGRFGQITGRILGAKKIPFTALEKNPEQVDFVRRFGNKIFYGDASRLDLLQAANADKASIFVLAIDDIDESIKTAEIVKQHFPNLNIYARARNRQHAYKLMDLGITQIRRETFASALEIAGLVLTGLGLSSKRVKQSVDRFRKHDVTRLYASQAYHNDEEKMIASVKDAAKELEGLFESDKTDDNN